MDPLFAMAESSSMPVEAAWIDHQHDAGANSRIETCWPKHSFAY